MSNPPADVLGSLVAAPALDRPDLLAEPVRAALAATGLAAHVAEIDPDLMRVLADRLVKGDVTAALGNLAASPASTITEEGAKAAATVLQGMVEAHATQAPVESTATTGTGILAKITGG